MNKNNAKQIQKQLEVICRRMEALGNRINKENDRNIQELYLLNTLLVNLTVGAEGNIETNKALLK